jgi:hypothetical protein
MREHIQRGELNFFYIPKFREYGISYSDGGSSIQQVNYCPWCGGHLPSSLRNDWFEALEKQGIDPDGEIPEIYLSDKWWRNT